MVSINSINGAGQQPQNRMVNAIKPETRQELQALGVNVQNVKTEAQAQEIIKQFHELEQVQSQFKAAQSQNIQDMKPAQQVQNTDKTQQNEAFAGGQAAAMQNQQPFDMMNQILAQQNRLKLGLI